MPSAMKRSGASLEQDCLSRVFKSLESLTGLKFEFQGEIQVSRTANAIRFCIAPLEWIDLTSKPDGSWSVEFNINDADGHGLPWLQTGAFGHVIHAFRGYILHQCHELMDERQLKAVLALG